jgi:hypothetical protein
MDVLNIRTLAWLGLALGIASCEVPATEADFDDQDVASLQDTGRGGDGGNQVAVVDFENMSGTWAHAVDLSSCVTVTASEELRSQTLSLVTIEQNELKLTETHNVCQLNSTPLIGLETVVPESVFTLPNPLTINSALYGANIGDNYVSDPRVALWGVEFDDAFSDPFPVDFDADDPREFDEDGDGNPGVTLKVGGDACDLYVSQRDLKSFHGQLQVDGSILGTTSALVEQRSLGSTNIICATRFVVRSNQKDSIFKMVRIDERGIDLDMDDDGEVTCDELIAGQDRVITWLEADSKRCQ